jgi:hypothetical protein
LPVGVRGAKKPSIEQIPQFPIQLISRISHNAEISA